MTKEEAIKRIQQDLKANKKYLSKEYMEALRMAIEALSERNIARDIATILENEQDMRVILQNAESIPVVRCKDCRYCTEYYDRDGYPYWECAEWDGGTDADGFCHYGERGEE